jgi:hypothetical protein
MCGILAEKSPAHMDRRGATENAMFFRVGVGECAIIIVLLLILITAVFISVRLKRQ